MKIRVGFVLDNFGTNWVGGKNYFLTLFRSIALDSTSKLHVVLIVPPEALVQAQVVFPDREIIGTPWVRSRSLYYFLRKISLVLLRRDFPFESWLRRRGIKVLSHGTRLGRNSSIPSIGWIPDFQHVHLPDHFSKQEIAKRSQVYRKILKDSKKIIVSSRVAREDANRFLPGLQDKLSVMHFTPVLEADSILGWESLKSKYSLNDRYLFLPNQLWRHKNHETVIRAISLLKTERGSEIYVLCTGAAFEPRNKDHPDRLIQLVKNLGIEANFRFLGLVSYNEMLSLMYYSHGVINPSLSEGWSTTVEEAKLLGKRVLLSDIPVHREQSPEHGRYFDPLDVSRWASGIQEAWLELPLARSNTFGQESVLGAIKTSANYSQIVDDALATRFNKT